MFEAFKKILANEDWNTTRRVQDRDPKWWAKLAEGADLRFGVMPVDEVSCKEFKVKSITTYMFGETALKSHMLTDLEGQQTLQMIVAEGGAREMYLAISRPLQTRDIERLFAEEDAKRVYQKNLPRRLYVREHTPGLREWVTMQYKCQLMAMKGKKDEQGKISEFEYSLFVNDANSKAIEFEYYSDGKLQVYVTLYRPLNDVINVRHAPVVRLPAEPKPKPQSPMIKPAEVVEHPAVSKKKEEKKDARSAAKEGPALTKPSVPDPAKEVVPVINKEKAEQFTCDIKVAGRLIDEAMRNNLPLSDVVRKILGLKLDVNEQVTFELPLSKDDYRTLALRYQIEPTDHPAIFHHIREELKNFAGGSRK